MDFGGVVHPQAEPAGVLDMTGLPEEAVHVRVLLPFGRARAEILHVAFPYRNRAFLFALVVNDVDQEAIDGDRIGSELHLFRIEPIAFVPGKWSAMPDPA